MRLGGSRGGLPVAERAVPTASWTRSRPGARMPGAEAGMNRWQKNVLVYGAMLIVLLFIFPPWVTRAHPGMGRHAPPLYHWPHFVASPPADVWVRGDAPDGVVYGYAVVAHSLRWILQGGVLALIVIAVVLLKDRKGGA